MNVMFEADVEKMQADADKVIATWQKEIDKSPDSELAALFRKNQELIRNNMRKIRQYRCLWPKDEFGKPIQNP